nr:NAD(P)H-plastoquinone-oxidoreductase 18 kda polypeptide {N-terminal} [Synechocystis, PCC6803, Peptide Partial, 17 aa] [Synechocystis]
SKTVKVVLNETINKLGF